jgi:hypothetical protein
MEMAISKTALRGTLFSPDDKVGYWELYVWLFKSKNYFSYTRFTQGPSQGTDYSFIHEPDKTETVESQRFTSPQQHEALQKLFNKEVKTRLLQKTLMCFDIKPE